MLNKVILGLVEDLDLYKDENSKDFIVKNYLFLFFVCLFFCFVFVHLYSNTFFDCINTTSLTNGLNLISEILRYNFFRLQVYN